MPLPGVSILLKGTSNGTTTDAMVIFPNVPAEGGTLIFSFIGRSTHEEKNGDRTIFDLLMEADIRSFRSSYYYGIRFAIFREKPLVHLLQKSNRMQSKIHDRQIFWMAYRQKVCRCKNRDSSGMVDHQPLSFSRFTSFNSSNQPLVSLTYSR